MGGMLTDFLPVEEAVHGVVPLAGTCLIAWVFEQGIGGRFGWSIGIG